MLKLLAFVLPLGLDSFAVAAAIGAAQAATAWQRARISLVFMIFEGGMPLLGLGLGSALAHAAAAPDRWSRTRRHCRKRGCRR